MVSTSSWGTVRVQSYDPSLFTAVGIDPLAKDILLIKSTNHFYAAFSKIVSEILYCSAGRPYPNDPATTPYRRARRDIWPMIADPHGTVRNQRGSLAMTVVYPPALAIRFPPFRLPSRLLTRIASPPTSHAFSPYMDAHHLNFRPPHQDAQDPGGGRGAATGRRPRHQLPEDH